MSRRVFLVFCLLPSVFLFSTSLIVAQQPQKVTRIGFLSARSEARGIWKRLGELGYLEGQGIVVVRRNANGKYEQLPKLAAELVASEVDVIVVTSALAAQAAKGATKTIPIVAVTGVDLVRAGLVDSLARPGGNVTGFTMFSPELGGKRVQLLKEAFPGLSRMGVLMNPDMGIDEEREFNFQNIETAAAALGVEHHALIVSPAQPDFDGAFELAKKRGVNGLLVVANQFFAGHRARILNLVAAARLPAIYNRRSWVRSGGLMFYGPRRGDLYKPAAGYVDRILKGEKPGELPVQRATRFLLEINLKAAKQIGITIPPEVLYRADKVIK
jgi:putative tryptophan/tyrosine transport system substrate-binding protein